MPRTRMNHPPSLKAKVAVEAIKAHKTAAHLTIGSSQYRIAYSLDHPHSLLIVHLIQSRENFYAKLKHLFCEEWMGCRRS